MASVVQKYFIVSGMVTRSSSHRRKKWSIAVRAVKITAVYSGMDIFWSEFFGGQTFYFDKRTKNDIYTIFFCNIVVGRFFGTRLGLRNKNFLNFQSCCIFSSTKLYINILDLYTQNRGVISRAQRYTIK